MSELADRAALRPPPTSSAQLPARARAVRPAALLSALTRVRDRSRRISAPLGVEDQMLQSMPDASPIKWHLAHTSWFFETLLLVPHDAAYRPFDARYGQLFNSYYEALGPRHPRPQRGLLSRPTLDEVWQYRAHVDAALRRWLEAADAETIARIAPLMMLGLQHEQQHQELMLTDLKHAWSQNPLLPAYPADATCDAMASPSAPSAPPLRWVGQPGGIVQIGAEDDSCAAGPDVDPGRFAFDNEGPCHNVLLAPYSLASRVVTCGDYLAFIADGGYRQASLWLSDGWACVQQQGWAAPLYWLPQGDAARCGGLDDWRIYTLHGLRALDPAEPVCHLSFYEAAAYAAWAGARLPTEHEWEAAMQRAGHQAMASAASRDNDSLRLHPAPIAAHAHDALAPSGQVWEWTASAYLPYPGFRTPAGAVGEYNGKFMLNQMVLRGGSCASPPGHARIPYRNFFAPHARWQFSGLRLARDGA